jgi:putative ABC transport system permease protein
VAVISESTAKRFWPEENPIGQHFSLDLTFRHMYTDFEVVGIAKDIRSANIARLDPSHVYLPADGALPWSIGTLVFRVRGDRDKAMAAVQTVVESVDRDLLPGMTISNIEEGPLAMQRNLMKVTETFAGVLTLLSLTLAGVGIYGVMSFLVSHRIREIGIRIALGATSRKVLQSVMLQGLRPVIVGTLLGFGAALAVDSVVRAEVEIPGASSLFSMFGEPALYAELAFVLVIALLASAVPAKRALRVDPMVALRYE